MDQVNRSPEILIFPAISVGERAATRSRQRVIMECLKKWGCNLDKIPTIMVLGSGGGTRASIACQATLTELAHQGLLDSIMYFSGVSGSTWCMSSLYAHGDWSQELEKAEAEMRSRITEGSWDLDVALEKAKWAAGLERYSLTDFWAYFVVYEQTKMLQDDPLTSIKEQSEKGLVPYPIFSAVDRHYLQQWKRKLAPDAWFEFTVHTAGFPAHGAYVTTNHFGCRFKARELESKKPERELSYLRGLCGSALGDFQTIMDIISDAIKNLLVSRRVQDKVFRVMSEGHHCEKILLDLLSLEIAYLGGKDCLLLLNGLRDSLNVSLTFKEAYKSAEVTIQEWDRMSLEDKKRLLSQLVEKIFELPLVETSYEASFFSFLRKTLRCLLNWDWGSTNNFLYKLDDINAPEVTERKVLHLVDAGLALNSAYPLALHPARHVDLILSFDFSSGDPFETIKVASDYCQANGIPFPPVNKAELDRDAKEPSDCYVFQGGEREQAPIVMHFPLFNRNNCGGGAEADIEQWHKRYPTFRISGYSKDDFDKLVHVAKMNVRHQAATIVEKIKELGRCASHV
ncbi:cytosolic phospholipase A2 gamma [Tachyglossus aculeatus]|uniref:cytosolic phospholipase A2 gamma n=1 Tax=Tachyglossus aculeatus TaxID=9261 RepID=UPI0018F5789E|nr:cytosolic phospholipase A2 gamma [Tachyglossus aculeatus]